MHLLRRTLERLHHWQTGKRSPVAPPAGTRLVVGVVESWGDFDEAVNRSTPGTDPLWEGVAFLPLAQCSAPDFVLVLNDAPRGRNVAVDIAPERLWFACGEPPGWLHRPLHEGQGDGSIVLCGDETLRDVQNTRTYLIEPCYTASWRVHRSVDELTAMTHVEKTRHLSWVTSDLTLTAGHRTRMRFLRQLQGRVDFDLFGRGFSPLADKWDGIAPYRYSIAFENTVAPGYFTEKIMDCFVCHTMPLYFGAPDVTRYFPPQAFLRIDPEDPKVFDLIRDVTASDLWQESLPYILEAKELVLRKHNCFARLAAHFTAAAQKPPSTPRRTVIKPVALDWNAAQAR